MKRRLVALPLAVLSHLLYAGPGYAAYSPATPNGWIVTAGRVQGLTGSLFRTDLWLFNPDAKGNVGVTLAIHPAVVSGQPAAAEIRSAPIALAPRETRFFPDVTLTTVPAGDGVVGALEWEASGAVMGAARIYTAAASGTFGFFLPGVPSTQSMTAKTSAGDAIHVLQIFGLSSGDANFRTNLDLVNTSSVTLPIEVRVIDPVTLEVYGGTQNYSLAAGSLLRLGQILAAVAAPTKDGLRITAAVREGTAVPSGGVLAAAYTLDNRTDDAFAFVGERQEP